MRYYIDYWLVVMAITLLLAGCAIEPATVKQEPDSTELVWPMPPEQPRIRYLYTITEPKDINIRQGWLQNVLGFLKGDPRKRIVSPYGVSKDAEGRVYVVDTFYKAVHVFDTKNAKHYLFPEKSVPDFLNPIGVALGSKGRIYVSDSGSGRVHVFTEQGKTFLKSIGTGQLQRPTGLAVNRKTGELLVLDTLASRLVVFDEQDLHLKRVVGKESKDKEGFHYPTNITVSNQGQVYITDSLNFRIQVLSPDLVFLHSFGAAGDGPGHFSRPKGIATDSGGNVYVIDALFDNVQIFDSEGRLLLAFGSPGSGRGEFWLPNAIYIDKDDRIYISDSSNQRVQVFQFLYNEVTKP